MKQKHKVIQISSDKYGALYLTNTGFVLRMTGNLEVQSSPEDIDKCINKYQLT